MTSFSSLPVDILLVVFGELDVVDFICLGMTCKGLYHIAQHRRVWVGQLQKLRQEHPFLMVATPPLSSLSVKELKTFVVGWAKLRRRFNDSNKNLDFAAKGVTEIPGLNSLILLPGGRSLLAINSHEGYTALCRVELEDGQASLPVVANIKFGERMDSWRRRLLTTTSPCPLLVDFQSDEQPPTVWITRIDHHRGAMDLEANFSLPRRSNSTEVDGQGRLIGFVVQQPPEISRVVVIHLDHPGVTVEADILPTSTDTAVEEHSLWKICMPAENLVIVSNHERIFGCKIPNFLDLSPGTHTTSVRSTWSWPGLVRSDEIVWDPGTYSEAIYDPHSAREIDLYYVEAFASEVVTVTVPIDTCGGNDGDHPSELSGLPALKQESSLIDDGEERWGTCDRSKGLYFRRFYEFGGVTHMVVPLRSPGNSLWMFLPQERPDQGSKIDIDEATGRVIFWRWDTDERATTRIVVGNLV